MGALMLFAAVLSSTATAQVGPIIAPDTANPAGDVEAGISADVLNTMVSVGEADRRLMIGTGGHLDWTPTRWATVGGSLYGFTPVAATHDDGIPSWHGFAALDAGGRLGPVRLGLWSGAGRIGAIAEPTSGGIDLDYAVGLYGGPSLAATSQRGRLLFDAHVSLVVCSFGSSAAGQEGALELGCPMYQEGAGASEWLGYVLSTSEYGLDLVVNDRDSVRFAMTSLVPTIGWRGRFDRMDVSVLWGSLLLGINFLQIRIDTHPLQWKRPPERNDPASTWVEESER